MHVVFVIHHFFPRPTGATYAAFRLADTLRKLGVLISWVVEERGPEWREGGVYNGFLVQSFRLAQSGKVRKLFALARLSRFAWAQRKAVDVFHIHGGGYVNLFCACWLKRLTGRPVMLKITSDGWDTPEGMRREKWGRLSTWFYRQIDGVVAMTSGQANKCRAWKLPAALAVIPNGVDCKRYRPATLAEKGAIRKVLGLPHDAWVLVYVGWLGKGKGSEVLLQTWQKLRSIYPQVWLMLVGDYLKDHGTGTDLATFLEQQGFAGTLLNDPQLKVVGHVQDVERYLQAADTFIFPSRREGFGTVQIEAMACGLSCVVNDLPGVSCDIFPDETVGFRIIDNDVDSYVRVLAELIQNPARQAQIGAAARARVVAEFSLESVGQKYLSFYEGLRARSKR